MQALKLEEAFNAELAKLSPEQRSIFEDVVYHKKSVFITGPGGVGKSFLIHMIKKAWIRCKREFWLTATTGVAAVNLGGTTIHSASGLGVPAPGITPKEAFDKMSSFVKKNWKACQSIILDEISMMDPEYFKLLDGVGRLVHTKTPGEASPEPFGGIQVVVLGDFFQLPPIHKNKTPEIEFCYELPLWKVKIPFEGGIFDKRPEINYFDRIVALSKSFRQGSDVRFFDLLNRVRFGLPSKEDIALLEERFYGNLPVAHQGLLPTKLFPRNDGVDSTNALEFSKLSTGRIFTSIKGFENEFHQEEENDGYDMEEDQQNPPDEEEEEKLLNLKNEMTPEERCNWNMTQLAKGTKEREGTKVFAEKPISWTIEIEKLMKNCPVGESVELRIGTQVMLTSNIHVTSGLVNGARGIVRGFEDSFPFHPVVFFAGFKKPSSFSLKNAKPKNFKWLVRGNETLVVIQPFTWRSPMGTPVIGGQGCKGFATYSQIPLRQAWAISIHKSQSITLDVVEMQLGDRVFAPGQAYVAMSRCSTLEGMTLTQFVPSCIRAHPKTTAYYVKLEKENSGKGNGTFVPSDILPLL
jgi:ATP-dependent DNA helicase PIF1